MGTTCTFSMTGPPKCTNVPLACWLGTGERVWVCVRDRVLAVVWERVEEGDAACVKARVTERVADLLCGRRKPADAWRPDARGPDMLPCLLTVGRVPSLKKSELTL